MGANTEIHFLPVNESHTIMHYPEIPSTIRLDGRSTFTGSFFPTLSNHEGAFHGLCVP